MNSTKSENPVLLQSKSTERGHFFMNTNKHKEVQSKG